MALDKDKIEGALLKQGLSSKRSKIIADRLSKEDLIKEEKEATSKKKKKIKNKETYKDIKEVLKED